MKFNIRSQQNSSPESHYQPGLPVDLTHTESLLPDFSTKNISYSLIKLSVMWHWWYKWDSQKRRFWEHPMTQGLANARRCPKTCEGLPSFKRFATESGDLRGFRLWLKRVQNTVQLDLLLSQKRNWFCVHAVHFLVIFGFPLRVTNHLPSLARM